MVKLSFTTTEEFQASMNSDDRRILDGIVSGIGKALQHSDSSADLFEIYFEDSLSSFQITLPRTEWQEALNTCIKKYEKEALYDDAIETYQLLEKLKNV